MKYSIRIATEQDADRIYELIKELAVFEKLEKQLLAGPSDLRKSIFEKNQANAIVAEFEGIIVSYAIYFYSFSTFLCKKGLYLEDLYVQEKYRGLGIGKAMLVELARIAVEQDCGRFEWTVLNWNQNAIDFYKSLGAESMDEWIINRVSGQNLIKLANL